MVDKRSNARIDSLEIYTDGSLKKIGSKTFGGWSFMVLRGGQLLYEASGSLEDTTNQRMELLAISNALEYAAANRSPSENVKVYSDSAYAVNCYEAEWYVKWLANGWFSSTGTPVANQDLWEKIIPYYDNYWYTFIKVKGHENNYWNNQCDALAQGAAQELKDNYRGHNDG